MDIVNICTVQQGRDEGKCHQPWTTALCIHYGPKEDNRRLLKSMDNLGVQTGKAPQHPALLLVFFDKIDFFAHVILFKGGLYGTSLQA